MLKIGITGGIGTGKTTVCRVFESLGIAVYYADKEAKKFYRQTGVIHAVKALFGETVFDADNNLNSASLAGIVFNDPIRLRQLNAIIHPLVLDDFISWAEKHKESPYILYESALLFESGFYKQFDKSILVTAPAELCKSRVMAREQMPEAHFEARKARQMTETEKEKLADIILANNEEKPLIPRIMDIHLQISGLTE